MEMKEILREDLWKTIKMHYQKEDYTESLRDAMFLIKDILQEKSGFTDKDNTGLVEACLLGKNPVIKLNKLESDSEKDFQSGIGFALKGLCMHLRNPMSHERVEYGKDDADSILIYINYLLKQIDKSSGRKLIDDWMSFLCQPEFTNTEEYAKELIKELPAKQRYDLLLGLYKSREHLQQNSVNYFIGELVEKLSVSEKSAFIEYLNQDLKDCLGNYALSMFFHFFAGYFYDDLKKIVKLHIEDIVLRGIKNGQLDDKKNVNQEIACIATWTGDCIDKFSNSQKIYEELLRKKLGDVPAEKNYVNKFFLGKLSLYNENNMKKLGDIIKKEISCGISSVYNYVTQYYNKELREKSKVYNFFKNEIDKYERGEHDLPF